MKSLKRESESKDRNVGAKKRRMTTVEKNTSRSSFDQNVDAKIVQQILQGI